MDLNLWLNEYQIIYSLYIVNKTGIEITQLRVMIRKGESDNTEIMRSS